MGTPVSENARTIRLYQHWQRPFGEPYCWCTPAEADNFLKRRWARRRMGGFAIQMRDLQALAARRRPPEKKPQRIVLHGRSCQMGSSVTEDAAFGEDLLLVLARRAALAYLFSVIAADNQIGAYCPLMPEISG